MIGTETVATLEQRAQAIETQIDRAPATELLPEARKQLGASEAELARDVAELQEAESHYSAKHWAISRYVPGSAAQALAAQELVPRETEIDGDKSAIARLSRAVRTLNQRIDAASYQSFEDHRVSPATSPTMKAARATLFAATGDVAGSSARFDALRGHPFTEATASLLAVSASPNVRKIFDAVRKAGVGEWDAAVLAGAAADAGATDADAVRAVEALEPNHGRHAAALLAAAGFASGKSTDQMDAAHDHFVKQRTSNAIGAAAGWALVGRSSATMTAITTAQQFQRWADDQSANNAVTIAIIAAS